MTSLTETNKALIRRYNKEVIEQGNRESFRELVADTFINHTAAPGTDNGPEGVWGFFEKVLWVAMPNRVVNVLDQIAEDDKVVTRKIITGTHQGPFMGIEATGRPLTIKITDIIRVVDGKMVEHWGSADMLGALAQIREPAM